MTPLRHALAGIILSLLAQPAWAQITVLDSAQDSVAAPAVEAAPVSPPPPCGTEPVSIARMSWPSAATSVAAAEASASTSVGCFDRGSGDPLIMRAPPPGSAAGRAGPSRRR